jgi:SAM-dependent methyltransferase
MPTSVNPRWYETFFDEHALDVWQNSLTEEQTAAEVDYLDAILALDDGDRVLDLACGNGRHAVALAARGHRMTGIDIAAENRARAATRAAAAGVSVELITGDITRLEYEACFDAAYLWGNSFGYFDRDGSAAFLAAVARSLEPGGRFVIETAMAAESILGDLARRSWMQISEDTRLLLEARYHPRESRLDTVYTTLHGDRVVGEGTAHVWIYTSGELVAMAEAAGFEVLDLHADLEGESFEVGDDQLIAILERKAA